MSRHLRGAAAGLALLTVLVAGCAYDEDEAPRDVLLGRADVAPLDPSFVKAVPESGTPAGTQAWSCGENEGFLIEDGWKFKMRDLRNTDDNWALYSAVLTNPSKSPAEVISSARDQIAACNEEEPMYEELDLPGEAAYGYRSIGPDGRIDTVRAYAPVGDHSIVQLTLLGLNGKDAPDQIDDLLTKAVDKAS